MNFFDKEHLKVFDWRELNGRTLRIHVVESEEGMIAYARDTNANRIYILHTEAKGYGDTVDTSKAGNSGNEPV